MAAQGSVGFRWGTITGPYHANFSQVETQKFDPHWFYCLQWGCNNLFCQERSLIMPYHCASMEDIFTGGRWAYVAVSDCSDIAITDILLY